MRTVSLAATSNLVTNVTLNARQVTLCRQTTNVWVSGNVYLPHVTTCVANRI